MIKKISTLRFHTNRLSSSLVETARCAQKLGLTRVTYILEVRLGTGLKTFLEVRGPFQSMPYEIAQKNGNYRGGTCELYDDSFSIT